MWLLGTRPNQDHHTVQKPQWLHITLEVKARVQLTTCEAPHLLWACLLLVSFIPGTLASLLLPGSDSSLLPLAFPIVIPSGNELPQPSSTSGLGSFLCQVLAPMFLFSAASFSATIPERRISDPLPAVLPAGMLCCFHLTLYHILMYYTFLLIFCPHN